ncbi:MAG: ABC transporter substrate-binding protein [Acidimicrobiales bacterium]
MGPKPLTTTGDLTASYKGVTETTITIGVSMLDFDDLVSKNLSKAGWGDQIAVYDALIADLNAKGGILGRMVEPVYEYYTPISGDDATRACNALTQDNDVFAVLGGFLGPLAGTADPCITGLNDTILIGGDQTADELDQSTAPWYQPGQSAAGSTDILLGLLDEAGELDGAKVFVMGGQADEVSHQPVLDALADKGVEVVGDAIIVADDGDTVGQDSELQVITEQIKSKGATAVFVHGTPSASVRGLAAAGLIETLDVWANNPAGLNNLGATITDKSVVNGVVTAAGPDDQAIWDDPLYQSQCSDVVAAAVPEADIRPPLDYAEEEDNWFNNIRSACRFLDLFVQIATAAGTDLTPDSFQAGAETLTDFALPGGPSNSLSDTKFFAEDRYALATYDSTSGDGPGGPHRQGSSTSSAEPPADPRPHPNWSSRVVEKTTRLDQFRGWVSRRARPGRREAGGRLRADP